MNTDRKFRPAMWAVLALVALFGFGFQASTAKAFEGQGIPSHLGIDMKQAMKIAQDVGGGPVTELELEQEDGNWVYEATLTLPQGGEKEILIDSQTGKVLKMEVENEGGEQDKD